MSETVLRNREASRPIDIAPRPLNPGCFVRPATRDQIQRQADEYGQIGAATTVVRVRGDFQRTQGMSSLRQAIEDNFSYRTLGD